ncbi:BglG family transcription antiterminator [Salibacterium halotolerans]|uniref:Transcriptional antiterminator n=1 Tax=Salibacterium halotolerans TaxID=1884432 RepID=A0A1I5PKG3_9BACI|nr:PRD domain-containing protein [Salibacterium halotolerans]SFP34608.1 Transcriptional antiterminator [Salibacterium halotolerans]
MLNERQRSLMQLLLEKDSHIKLHELAGFYSVSERTIRNDVNEVEYFITQYKSELERDKSQGVMLKMNDPEKKEVKQWLQHAGEYTIRLSPLERMITILGILFQYEQPVTSKTLSDIMHVTRRTVLDDLRKLEDYLESHQVGIQYKSNKGFILDGRELNIRRSYKELSNQFGDDKTFEWLLEHLNIPEHDILLLRDKITRLLQWKMPELTDFALQGIIIHSVLSLQRLKQNKTVQLPPYEIEELKKYEEFQTGKQIIAVMEEFADDFICEEEASFITLHLLSSKTLRHIDDQEDHKLQQLVQRLIAKISFQSGIDFMDDTQLEQGLIIHLKPAIYRLRFQLGLNNPMKHQIEDEYDRLSQWITWNLNEIEEEFGISFNIDEICFLTLHFAAAIERRESRTLTKVILVCGSGIGTVQLMKSRLKRLFPEIMVTEVIPYHKLQQARSTEGADFIFSTTPVEESSIPSITINPMIEERDQQKISELLIKKQERKSGPVLENVLKSEFIQLDVPAEDWMDAIRIGGRPLVEHHMVEPKYIDAMIQMVTENGPYVVLDKGVAMPHARPEEGVNELCLSFVRLSTPVHFGHEANDPVQLVFCLGSTDAETHLRALRQLVTALNEENSKSTFMTGDSEDILQTIKEASLL